NERRRGERRGERADGGLHVRPLCPGAEIAPLGIQKQFMIERSTPVEHYFSHDENRHPGASRQGSHSGFRRTFRSARRASSVRSGIDGSSRRIHRNKGKKGVSVNDLGALISPRTASAAGQAPDHGSNRLVMPPSPVVDPGRARSGIRRGPSESRWGSLAGPPRLAPKRRKNGRDVRVREPVYGHVSCHWGPLPEGSLMLVGLPVRSKIRSV